MPGRFDRETDTHLFNSFGYSLIAVVSMCVIAYVLLYPKVIPCRILASRPFVFIGSISYGLYLCHISVMLVMMRITHLNLRHVFVPSIAAAIICSWLSFRFYETPIMAWGHRVAAKVGPARVPGDLPAPSAVPGETIS